MKEVPAVTSVYTDSHLVYTSGMHGDGYVDYRDLNLPENKALLIRVTIALLKKAIVEGNLDTSKPITVIGPETLGAAMVDHIRQYDLTGSHNLLLNTCRLMKTDTDKVFCWERVSPEVIRDTQIIWMDDLLNRCSTFEATQPMVTKLGAKVNVIAVIGDRSGARADNLNVSAIVSMEKFDLKVYHPEICPICAKGVPILRHPGHGHKLEHSDPNRPCGYTG